MVKVLVLTYYWPPGGGAGVQRWLKFVKYMREFGYEPVVYTALNGEMPVLDHSLEKDIPAGTTVLKQPIWEPYTVYKRFIGRKKEDKINASFLNENRKAGIAEKISVWIRGNFFIPDARRFWISPSANFLSKFVVENKIQYVISTGPPHSMHLIALRLKKRHPELKWIADFRDPWTHIDFYEKLMLTSMADRKHHRKELSVLLSADKVISIGKGMSDQFAEIYTEGGGKDLAKFEVITNGFDEEDISKTPVALDQKFSLAHIGTLVKDRNAPVLWKVLGELVKENSDLAAKLQIKLVGKVDLFVKDELEKYGLSEYVHRIDYLPHDEVIKEQQRSRVLLLLVNNTANAKGILTGKFFEYMASGRPVLAIGPEDGDLAHIMKKCGCGLLSGFENTALLKQNILDLLKGHQPPRNEKEIAAYSRRQLTARLCATLDLMRG